jgi:hypothetical protein
VTSLRVLNDGTKKAVDAQRAAILAPQLHDGKFELKALAEESICDDFSVCPTVSRKLIPRRRRA